MLMYVPVFLVALPGCTSPIYIHRVSISQQVCRFPQISHLDSRTLATRHLAATDRISTYLANKSRGNWPVDSLVDTLIELPIDIIIHCTSNNPSISGFAWIASIAYPWPAELNPGFDCIIVYNDNHKKTQALLSSNAVPCGTRLRGGNPGCRIVYGRRGITQRDRRHR